MNRTRRLAGFTVWALSLSLTVTLLATTGVSGDAERPTVSTSVFRLTPNRERVDVTVKVTVVNRIPSRVSVGPCRDDPGRTCRITTRYYVDSFGYFSVQEGARNIRFTGPGVKASIHDQRDTFTNWVVRFAPIYAGQSRTFRVTYRLPAAGPRSPNRTRIMAAYAHFCWHGEPTDRGSVTAIVPTGFEPTTSGGAVKSKRTKEGTFLRAKRTRDLRLFYACTDSFRSSQLIRDEFASPRGQVVIVEGWPEDPGWTTTIRRGIAVTLPKLEEIAGTAIPGDDLVVRQVAAQALGGYAGDFSQDSDQIRVSETYDDPILVAHELAHAWYNHSTVRDTWLMEGYAEWMAQEANRRACVRPAEYPGKGAPRLRRWRYLAVDPSPAELDLVDYQYAAACDIIQQLEWLVGLERMTDISRALLDRTPKYGGTAASKPPRPDWREWLDAVDELGLVPAGRGNPNSAVDLLLHYGVATPRQLEGRAAAREAYHAALGGSLAGAMPLVVRDLMDDWQFDKAMKALDLAQRTMAVAAAAEAAGAGDVTRWVEPVLRDARSISELRATKLRLEQDPGSLAPGPAVAEPVQAAAAEPAAAIS